MQKPSVQIYVAWLGPALQNRFSSRIFILHDAFFHRLNLQRQHSGKVTAQRQIAPKEPEARVARSPRRRQSTMLVEKVEGCVDNVVGLPVHVPDAGEIPARGAALFGAVAAGVYDDIDAAIQATRPDDARVYEPDAQAHEVYDRVYGVYRSLYDILGRREDGLLHELKHIRGGIGEGSQS